MSCRLSMEYVKMSKNERKVNEMRLKLRYGRDDEEEATWKSEDFTLRR